MSVVFAPTLSTLSVPLLPFSHTPFLLHCQSSSLLLSHSSTSRHTLSLSYTPLLILFSPSQTQSPTLSILRTLSLHSLFPYSLFHTLLSFYVVNLLLSYSLTPLSLDTLVSFIRSFAYSMSVVFYYSQHSSLFPYSLFHTLLCLYYSLLLNLNHPHRPFYALSLCNLCSLTPFFTHSFPFTLSIFFSPTLWLL